MVIEVESNENCSVEVYQRFKELSLPRPVRKVCIYDRTDEGEWCWVTGWSDAQGGSPAPAFCQQVEDSGAGATFLIYGARFGVRLRPVASKMEWALADPGQWGEPFLAIADESDIEFA